MIQVPASVESGAAVELTPEQSRELSDHRTILTNNDNTVETLTIEAKRLVQKGWPQAFDLILEILTNPTASNKPKLAVCRAVMELAGAQGNTIDERVVDALLNLLGDGERATAKAAGMALAAFPDNGVAKRAAELAADSSKSPELRSAALDVLAPNITRKDVVEQLVRLLDHTQGPLFDRVLSILRDASRMDHGRDVDAWKAWWTRKSSLSNEQWLRDRIELSNDIMMERTLELRQVQAEVEALRDDLAKAEDAWTGRLVDLFRQIQRGATAERATENVLRWLQDPTSEYRLAAIGLITDRINDGVRPSDSVHQALRERVSDGTAGIRKAALNTIGALNDPADAATVMALLANEREGEVRVTGLRVLGRLSNDDVIPFLIEELSRSDSKSAVRAAADSLGVLGAKGKVPEELITSAVEPLMKRWSETTADEASVRLSLVDAMASIGLRSFRPVFEELLEKDDDPMLLPAAISGIGVVGDVDNVSRLLELTTHGLPQVRSKSVWAVGVLGGDESHARRLVDRMRPENETDELVQSASWTAFKLLAGRRPVSDRFRWATMLRGLPMRQIEYLDWLVREQEQVGPATDELIAAMEQLVGLYEERGQATERISYLRTLANHFETRDPAKSAMYGLKLLAALLEADRDSKAVEQIKLPAHRENDAFAKELADVVVSAYRSRLDSGETERAESLKRLMEGLMDESTVGKAIRYAFEHEHPDDTAVDEAGRNKTLSDG